MTSGIVADNYKVNRFKEELDKAGFKYTVTPFMRMTSTIKVEHEESQLSEIKKICTQVELYFKRSK